MQDHHFDVVTNVVGLVAAILGDKFYWWIDPVGAILLAIYTITNWSRTVMENAGNSHQNFKQKNDTICIYAREIKNTNSLKLHCQETTLSFVSLERF
jgi:divalent metal cation (Fe/Co/Zn/Cd) transporter